MTEKLEVDGFEIDIEELDAAIHGYGITAFGGRWTVVNEVAKNLTQESKKRFEEYQEQNNPCKEVPRNDYRSPIEDFRGAMAYRELGEE